MAKLYPDLNDIQPDALPAWVRQPSQAATYPRVFMEVLGERGIPLVEVLARAGLPANLLEDPAGRLSLLEIWQLFDAVLAFTDDPTLGFEAGLRLPLTAHGNLGYALMCAATPREAIGILERFWHLRGRGVLMTVEETDDRLFFEITPEIPIPPALREFLFASILTSMHGGMRFMIPSLATRNQIWLQGEQPGGFEQLRDRLPEVCFGMPRAGVLLAGDKQPLDRPLPTANPEGLAQAIARCEQESLLIEPNDDVLRRTRSALTPGADGYPSPDELADMLHLSQRTFRRRLSEQGLSYQQLLEEARRRDSRQLLGNPNLEIRRIADMLGYADPANFTRAFRGWTGMSPRSWRKTIIE